MSELLRVRKDASSPPLNPSLYSKLHTVRNEKGMSVLKLKVKNIRTLRLVNVFNSLISESWLHETLRSHDGHKSYLFEHLVLCTVMSDIYIYIYMYVYIIVQMQNQFNNLLPTLHKKKKTLKKEPYCT